VVRRDVREMPVEARVVIPCARLGELVSHEEELLARLREHHRVEQAKVREALPRVAVHLLEERAAGHIVVRERKNEALLVRIDRTERQRILRLGSEHRIDTEVATGVVTAAEGPSQIEAETAQLD